MSTLNHVIGDLRAEATRLAEELAPERSYRAPIIVESPLRRLKKW